jgi:hypothetical protein
VRIFNYLFPNWSRPLPRPIVIPDVMELSTLPKGRVLIEKYLPPEYGSHQFAESAVTYSIIGHARAEARRR